MVRNRVGFLFLTGLIFALGAIVACGGSAAPEAEFKGNSGVVTTPVAKAPVATTAPAAVPVATKAPAAESTKPAGTLTIATRALRSGAGIPKFCTAGCAETIYLAGIFDTLTGVKAGPGGAIDPQNIPNLAESWTIADDLAYMDFKLRNDVKFHDGSSLTAEDVAFSYNNANADQNVDSIHGQAGDFAPFIALVEALDPLTVRMNFTVMYSAMPLRYISPFYQSAAIVSKKVFDKLGEEGMRTDFTGTGPFIMDNYKKNESIFAHAVDEHWRKVPAVKNLRILDIPETSARTAMLETGEAQIAGELAFKDVVRLQKEGYTLNRDNGYSQEISIFIAGNYWSTEHPQKGTKLERPKFDLPWVGIFGDEDSMERAKKVRHALAMTIDRENINDKILEGLGEVCYFNQISINQDGWMDKWEIPFDPEGARALLKEAGFEGGGFDVDMWIGPGGIRVELGEAVAGSWLKELGVKTNLDRITYTKYRPGLVQRTTSTYFMSAGDEGKTGFPVHWPKGMQGSAITDGGWGPGFEDPFYSQHFFKMNKEPDADKRMAMTEEYFDHVFDVMLQPCIVEAPYHPMYNPDLISEWTMHPSMNGNLSGANSFETVVLK
jgi:ABC-type transport system substrate-binding protein